ncbi:MAG: VTT domain-containing protein [Candidatus Pacebacteria bacterium]|nr:VTT domain-containing protein [Candidatus Paceibacterota bacterium]MDR3582765.1 VTT domain-containing protein [Candidatus Paceibacterota bacterium]
MSIFHLTSFSAAFVWVIAHGYFLMFLAMLVEGPIVTAAAAFATAFGYFDIWIVFLLSIFGDIVADVIYYVIGYYSRITVIEKFGHHFGLTTERMKKIEATLNNHPVRTLLALKMTPVLPTPGLMMVGATRMRLKKFITICIAFIIPKSIFFIVVGYYFGAAYELILKRFERGGIILGLVAVVIIFIYYAFGKFSARLGERVEKL